MRTALLALAAVACAVPAAASVPLLEVEGPITPIQARYLRREIKRADAEGAAAIVVRINTPGGLVTAMNKMVEAMANSNAPVVAYVAPRTAQAASAGAFLVLAADVAAMAPGTRIGSAHPVSGGGEDIGEAMEKKIVGDLTSLTRSLARRHNRNETFAVEMIRSSLNLSAEEALDTGAIDLIAEDEADLLKKIDGMTYERGGETRTISVAASPLVRRPPSAIERFLDALANPTLAAILLTVGVMGIIYEAWSPGVGFGAIVGGLSLLLGLIALAQLPIQIGALLLLLFGIVLLILETQFVSHGLLTLAGVAAVVLGGMYFLDTSEYFGAAQTIRWGVLAPTLLVLVAVFAAVLTLVVRALRSKPAMGTEALVGRTAKVRETVGPGGGLVFVDGAVWKAEPAEAGEISAGEAVEVVAVRENPTRLVVRRRQEGGA